ncbi:MAG: hypothetical protein GC208_10830 [Alphaproteobacteria bacterium]|nr:hypothetical protein [Alphaproteobacteria bacterium]
MRPALVLGFVALMFTAIPWIVASTFWHFGDPPARTQFAPRADAVVARIETEAVGTSPFVNVLVWMEPVEEGAFAPGRRLIADDLASRLPREVEAVEADYAPGTEMQVRVTDDALYLGPMGFFDYAAWCVTLFCLFVGGAGLFGVFVSFRMVLEGRG